jgi:uncharacterized membrane protein YgdD (TMEM256/DUF423 family)
MNKNFLSIASLLGALSVALGAFGAHKLKEVLPIDFLTVFETGVRYQFYHVFALFLVAILHERFQNKWMQWAGNCFIIGIILFCGSLYALTVLKMTDTTGTKYAGIITPFGGLFLIAGWLFLLAGITRNEPKI